MGRYSQGFKDRALARLLPPESAPITTVSQEQIRVGLRCGTGTVCSGRPRQRVSVRRCCGINAVIRINTSWSHLWALGTRLFSA